MLIAIPTVNKRLVTRRFGRMTEITFVEVENNKVINQYEEMITSHHNYNEEGCHNYEYESNSQKRHQEIKDKIYKADVIIYKSLCKNWRERLQDYEKVLKRTNNDLLVDVIEEIKNL